MVDQQPVEGNNALEFLWILNLATMGLAGRPSGIPYSL